MPVEGIVYEMTVYQSGMDFIHGFSTTMEEIYVPSMDLSVSRGTDNVTCQVFRPDSVRYNDTAVEIGKVTIDDEMIIALSSYFSLQEQIMPRLSNLLPKKKSREENSFS